jgi:3-dehydroquinate synthase
MQDENLAAVVNHSGGSYPILVGRGLLDEIGDRLLELGFKGPAYIVSDDRVFSPYGEQVQSSLRRSGIEAHSFVIPSGEPSKSMEQAEPIYRWLVERRAERGHPVIAVGGGVVGDLAGFVAATFLRGVPFIQVPTSLAAMVDASIGGKTAVNLSVGKNLVGAFYQPRAVMADLDTLKTLSYREMASGWAEAIKHGLILDASLFQLFEEEADALMELAPDISAQVIRRSMEIKARVVEEDERETLGRRMLLNYGHTTGHALEAVTHYTELLHGEAVAIGMRAAAEISQRMGLLSPEVAERQNRLLMRFGLPTSSPGADPEGVLRAIELDKKASSKTINWVLMEEIGRVTVRSDVPQELVRQTVEDICK